MTTPNTIQLNLAWQSTGGAGQLAMQYAFYQFSSSAGNNVSINLDTVLTTTTDKPVRAACVEILQPKYGSSPQNYPYGLVTIDGTQYKIYGRFRKTFTTEKTLTIDSLVCPDLELRFYSQPVFGLSYAEQYGFVGPSSEALHTAIPMAISDSGTIWKWDASGTFPFNTGVDVTIPFRLRAANPNRVTKFAMVSGYAAPYVNFSNANNQVSAFSLFWGPTQADQSIPINCGYNDAVISGSTQNTFYLEAFNSQLTGFNGTLADYSTAPFISLQKDLYNTATGGNNGAGSSHQFPIPTGEIWIVCKPLIPTSGHAGLYQANFYIDVH